jgi:hypothetical protein
MRSTRRPYRAWEFLPAWAAYAPIVPWIAALAVRYGGLRAIAAANPGFPDGGLVGESKFDILRVLPAGWTLPSGRICAGAVGERLRAVEAFADACGGYPLVLKPDVGQRGAGVRKVGDTPEARAYLEEAAFELVAQPWHPGPFEAGIFYWRHPGADRGAIFSITSKVFPEIEGDGRRSIVELIRAHPRYARQARVFETRHRGVLARVLSPGERLRLCEVGNHCQGTLFLDGSGLRTPALERRIDEIARAVPGFFVGRFDVRYSDVDRFRAGDDLAIIELNGVTAEPTDVYDPDRSIWSSYRALLAQWHLVFRIGAANLRRGHRGAGAGRLARIGLDHLLDRRSFPVSS